MENTSILTESKYIRSSGEVKAFSFISFMFFFTLYVMPQYFGFPLPVFDFTVLRIMLIIMFLFILGIKNKQREFLELIAQAPYRRNTTKEITLFICFNLHGGFSDGYQCFFKSRAGADLFLSADLCDWELLWG